MSKDKFVIDKNDRDGPNDNKILNIFRKKYMK